MADINSNAKIPPQNGGEGATPAGAQPRDAEAAWDIIELLFFAYRDFVGDPDAVLLKYAFGRAHHRVLHFVNRNPGMKVADEVAIGEKQQLDDVPGRLGIPQRAASRRHRLAAGGLRGCFGTGIYVSHVDIFWFYVTKTGLRT